MCSFDPCTRRHPSLPRHLRRPRLETKANGQGKPGDGKVFKRITGRLCQTTQDKEITFTNPTLWCPPRKMPLSSAIIGHWEDYYYAGVISFALSLLTFKVSRLAVLSQIYKAFCQCSDTVRCMTASRCCRMIRLTVVRPRLNQPFQFENHQITVSSLSNWLFPKCCCGHYRQASFFLLCSQFTVKAIKIMKVPPASFGWQRWYTFYDCAIIYSIQISNVNLCVGFWHHHVMRRRVWAVDESNKHRTGATIPISCWAV